MPSTKVVIVLNAMQLILSRTVHLSSNGILRFGRFEINSNVLGEIRSHLTRLRRLKGESIPL